MRVDEIQGDRRVLENKSKEKSKKNRFRSIYLQNLMEQTQKKKKKGGSRKIKVYKQKTRFQGGVTFSRETFRIAEGRRAAAKMSSSVEVYKVVHVL